MRPSSLVYFTFLFIVHMLPMTRSFPDEYLPKRIDTKNYLENTMMMDLSNEPDNQSTVNHTQQPVPYLPIISSCDASCFLDNPTQEMLQCVKQSDMSNKPENPITCEQSRSRGEIVLGQKESARAITAGALEHLLDPNKDWSSRAGQLSIHLNLNMVQLDPGAFIGLETLVTEVRLLNTVYMHPDSFLQLRHLRAFEIDSGLTPVPLFDKSQTESENWKTSAQQDKPMFLRMQPADMSMPISFNLETECHQCMEINNTRPDQIMIVVVFTTSRNTQQKKLENPDAFYKPRFSMLFPQTCPKSMHGLGCPLEANTSYTQTMKIPTEVIKSNEVSLTDLRDARIIITETKTPSLLILLSIWCSVLTLVIVLVVCVVYFCTKRLSKSKPVPKWFPAPCFTQQTASSDDLSSSSTNSAFYNRQPNFIQPEKAALFHNAMTESQTSWNSLHTKPPRSTSAHNLRDKHHRQIRASRASIDRHRHAVPARRSIGSQTDFTEMDTDTAFYSSLRRSGMLSRDYLNHDPPIRTSSQFALSRMRYNTRYDDTLPPNPIRPTRFSTHTRLSNQATFMLPPYNTGNNATMPNDSQLDDDPGYFDTIPFDQGTFLPVESELTTQPRGLPPLHPGPKAGSQSPAPWRKHLQNGLPLDV